MSKQTEAEKVAQQLRMLNHMSPAEATESNISRTVKIFDAIEDVLREKRAKGELGSSSLESAARAQRAAENGGGSNVAVADESRGRITAADRTKMRNHHFQTPNRSFSSNPLFQIACQMAGVPATKRQASKWRSQKGKAYGFRNQAVRKLAEDRKAAGK